MDTLTIEQKAKAYDKAIERANLYLGGNQLGNAWIYKILPELTESEDERIRKKIINLVKKHSVNHERCMMTAWLEKQGKQKPVKCIYSNGNYTDEERKALCDGCEEECRFNKKEESINNGLDLGCGVIWKDEEPVSEDLEQAIDTYLATYWGGEKEKQEWPFLKKMAIHFAEWQKQQMLAKAVDGFVIEDIEEGNGDFLLSADYLPRNMGLKDRQKVKVIIINGD